MRVHRRRFRQPVFAMRQALALVWLLIMQSATSAQTFVYFPRPESQSDARASFPIALLNLCADRSHNEYVMQPSLFSSQQERSVRQLAKNEGIDVLWAVTNPDREKLLLPIRIPIDRGLIGWRLLLIRHIDSPQFFQITDKSQLAALRAGQGHDWPDVDVLRANHLNVATSTTYEGLFKMLSLGHIQYFPRSISEIWPELSAHYADGLVVEGQLILHYREALYFFVNKNNQRLAAQLTTCLQDATADGSLRHLFYTYYRDAITKADIAHRSVIELDNPTLPEATPLMNAAYWFTPGETM